MAHHVRPLHEKKTVLHQLHRAKSQQAGAVGVEVLPQKDPSSGTEIRQCLFHPVSLKTISGEENDMRRIFLPETASSAG